VGPGKTWKSKREFQIQFLKQVGLKPEHYLLDLGCGTLRGGIPIIEYLEKGHYFGVEVDQEVLDEGRLELQEAKLVDKEPTLILETDVSSLNLNQEFDYIWAFAVLPHVEDKTLHGIMSFIRRHLKDDGCFYGTVRYGSQPDTVMDQFTTGQGILRIYRSLQFYQEVGSQHGLRVEEHHLPEQKSTGGMLKEWKA
jgi:SAM-dependent methyltransferase